jgi:hypothetical protein
MNRKAKNILVLVVGLMGVVAGVLCFFTATRDGTDQNTQPQPQSALSESTRAVLKKLDAPVQIRFYALLDPASVPVATQEFAQAVDQLLTEYEREAAGKVEMTRYTSRLEVKAAAVAAADDGFKPFNLERGDACYFGLVVAQDDRKGILTELGLERQQTLESDLTTLVERIARAKGPAPRAANTPPADTAATDEVKEAIPDLASVSIEEGARILREVALKDFKETVAAMEVQVIAAQDNLSLARSGGSEAEEQAAAKQLQKIQAEQTEKLRQIAARSAARVEALRQLKETTH